jgi:hypothetical protein
MDFIESLLDTTDSTPIYLYHYSTAIDSQPLESSKPILSDGYELRPCLIEMIQKQSFSGNEDENPQTQLNKFEQTCACIHIKGMSNETLRWRLFISLWRGKLKSGINELPQVRKGIRKPSTLAFV